MLPENTRMNTPGSIVSGASSYLTPTGGTPTGQSPNSAGGPLSSSRKLNTRMSADTPAAFAAEVNKLRSDLRIKSNEANELAVEVRTLKKLIGAKDAAIDNAEARSTAAEERALQAESEASTLRRAATKNDKERKKLQVELDAANAEADRLNHAVVNGGGSAGGGSVEDMVRLHNQLAEARKEIRRLKEDTKGAYNALAAKDKALEEMLDEAAAARETLDSRRGDQNVILDLKRQLTQAEGRTAEQEQLGRVAANEIFELKATVASKEEEIDSQRRYMSQLQAEVTASRKEASDAERAAAEARSDAATAEAVAQRARDAEALRMKEGGFVSRRVHLATVKELEDEADALKERLAAAQQEARLARVFRERLLGVVDDAVAIAIEAQDVENHFGSAAGIVDELRAEVKELRGAMAAKDADNAALLSSKDAAVARAAGKTLGSHHLKVRINKAIGEYDYTLEFNEPPPGPPEEAVAEARAAAAAEAAAASSVVGVAKERDAALLQVATAKLEAERARKAMEEAEARAAEAERVAQAAELGAAAAAVELASAQEEVAEKDEELAALRKELAETRGRYGAAAAEKERLAKELEEETRSAQSKLDEAAAALAVAAAAAATNVSTAETTVAAKEEELVVLRAEATATQQALVATSTSSAAKDREIATLRGESTAAKELLVAAKTAAVAKDEEITALKAKATANEQRLANIETAAASKDKEIVKLRAEVVAAMAAAASHLGASGAASAELAALTAQLTAKTEELASLQQFAEAAAGEADQLRSQLDEARREAAAATAAASMARIELEAVTAAQAARTGGDLALRAELLAADQEGTAAQLAAAMVSAAVLKAQMAELEEELAAFRQFGRPSTLNEQLLASRVQVADLKHKVDELESQLALAAVEAAALPVDGGGGRVTPRSNLSHNDDDEGSQFDDDSADGEAAAPRFLAGNSVEGAGMTPEALGRVLDRLMAARAEGKSDGELHELATAMLRAEMARLGTELADGSDMNARILDEMGALMSAQLSAEATAELLEQHNAMSMKVAALQIALGEKENEFARCEESMLHEIAALKAKIKGKKRKGALRSIGKAMSSAAKNVQKSLDSAVANVKAEVGASGGGAAPRKRSMFPSRR